MPPDTSVDNVGGSPNGRVDTVDETQRLGDHIMNIDTNIIELIKQAAASGGTASWQYQLGLVIGGAAVGVIGTVGGWAARKIWKRKRKSS